MAPPRRVAPTDLDELPMEPSRQRRGRLRRGGPRTPLPLVGLIAVCAGIGVAYVGQVAHATQATYEASQLQSDQQQLRNDASRLDDELARLSATERIVQAAQDMGMRPASKWGYVAAHNGDVMITPHAVVAVNGAPSDSLQSLIAAIGGAVGLSAPEQAAP